MKYAILIYDENTANPVENPDMEFVQKVFGEYMAFTDEINAKGINKGGEALQPNPTATTVRVRDGKTVTTDGPFAETKEGPRRLLRHRRPRPRCRPRGRGPLPGVLVRHGRGPTGAGVRGL